MNLIKMNNHKIRISHEYVSNLSTGMTQILDMLSVVIVVWVLQVCQLLVKVLLPLLGSNPPPDLEALRIYLILPLCHSFTPETYPGTVCPFGKALLQLNTAALKAIGQSVVE